MSTRGINVARLAWLGLLLTAGPASAQMVGKAETIGRPTPKVPIERFRMVDEGLFRGAQPTVEGFRSLKELGIKTIVNLRMEADSIRTDEKRVVESLGMKYVNIPVEDGNFFTRSRTIPEDAIRSFFAIVDARESGPVFVHCHRGADRTGAIVGFYRIARQGWDAARALREARDIGLRSWYRGLQQQIAEFSRLAENFARTPG